LINRQLQSIYRRLYSRFGAQKWWPADSAFEVIVGAILTQNTGWSNVEKALANLKKRRLLQPRRLYALPDEEMARLIRPAGYYNIKTARLKSFLKFFLDGYGGSIQKLSAVKLPLLRERLLAVKGIGPETADSILLYALHKPVFVIDAYTKRIFSRHRLIREGAGYDQVQELFTRNLKNQERFFNEYHALIVALGKNYCAKTNPKCGGCPLAFSRNSGIMLSKFT